MIANMKTHLFYTTMTVYAVLSQNVIHSQFHNHNNNNHHANRFEIATVLEGRGSFNVALDLLNAAGLLDTVKALEEVTLFLPTDDAFSNISDASVAALKNDSGRLNATLSYHIAPERFVTRGNIQDVVLTSLSGEPIRMSRYIFPSEERVLAAEGVEIDKNEVDIRISNGYVHGLNGVMEVADGDAVKILEKREDMTKLVKGLILTELDKYVNDEQHVTIFAPNDAAFNHLNSGVLQCLQNNTNLLEKILLHHIVIKSTFYGIGFFHSMFLETAEGFRENINIFKVRDGFYLNDANIVESDISATNGVVHVIDKVLFPADVVRALEEQGVLSVVG